VRGADEVIVDTFTAGIGRRQRRDLHSSRVNVVDARPAELRDGP
jgi:hypothetical protein